MGHRVEPAFVPRVDSGNTYLVTLMRDTWSRSLSDYNHIQSHPDTKHLSPEIDMSIVRQLSLFDYLTFPCIPNCATKVRRRILLLLLFWDK